MHKSAGIGSALLFLAAAAPAYAQNTAAQIRPELDAYIHVGTQSRLVFQDMYIRTPAAGILQQLYAGYWELALRPVFRRALRDDPDVFRRRYLTFRQGYQFITTDTNGNPSWENRLITELTARYPVAAGFVIISRNRGEYRFQKGHSFSTRYRHRLWLEHDAQIGPVLFTPYVYHEIFYDARYDSWTTNRLAVGTQFPIGGHVILEPYVMRQRSTVATPRNTNALGFKLNLYF